uniref:NADH dehydrogenase subunit 2 n=1 Tax=Mesocestoides corti TaxID=53468 RepID=A0A1E1GI48_MESCO|nr:NADH dehydrogenase subunit 2 [Mesocestoides corti]
MFFRRVFFDVFFFSFFFSVFFCFCCGIVDNLFSFWVFLELGGLALVPSFFYNVGGSFHSFYGGLFTYVVVSGFSSVLLVTGFLFVELYYFVLLGFIVKFGLFPFSLWVYRVFSSSNWFFIFLLSVVMKFPVLFFCFLFGGNCCTGLVYVDCFFTIFLCSVFVWFFSNSFEYIWCHISLSSVSTLVVACFCSDFFMCSFIYFYYFVWAICCLVYFYYLSSCGGFFGFSFWVYCFLLLVTPVSLPLFYKLGVCVSIVYSSIYLIVVWSIYSFSEQIFLYKFGSDNLYSSVYNCWV